MVGVEKTIWTHVLMTSTNKTKVKLTRIRDCWQVSDRSGISNYFIQILVGLKESRNLRFISAEYEKKQLVNVTKVFEKILVRSNFGQIKY